MSATETKLEDDWIQWAGDRIDEYLSSHNGPFRYKLPVGKPRSQWESLWTEFINNNGNSPEGYDYDPSGDYLYSDEIFPHDLYGTIDTGFVQVDQTGKGVVKSYLDWHHHNDYTKYVTDIVKSRNFSVNRRVNTATWLVGRRNKPKNAHKSSKKSRRRRKKK